MSAWPIWICFPLPVQRHFVIISSAFDPVNHSRMHQHWQPSYQEAESPVPSKVTNRHRWECNGEPIIYSSLDIQLSTKMYLYDPYSQPKCHNKQHISDRNLLRFAIYNFWKLHSVLAGSCFQMFYSHVRHIWAPVTLLINELLTHIKKARQDEKYDP